MASVSFLTYLKTNVENHIKALSILGGTGALVIGINYVRDLHAELANQEKITATLSQKFQQVGPSVVAGNSTGTEKQVTSQAQDVFGAAVIAYMHQQDAKIGSLTTAIGQTNATVSNLAQQPKTFTPGEQNTTSGALNGYPMEESRAGAPPLSSVDLFYNPQEKDPSKAFAGTTWTHYQEQFKTAFGTWEKQKDGGYKTTVVLNRTVSKPDPNDPTKMIQVGTENIPITGADTVFTPQGLTTGSTLSVPRWTVDLGIASTKLPNNSASQYGLFGSIDYRLTDRYGVFAGTVNGGLVGGVSIRLGGHK